MADQFLFCPARREDVSQHRQENDDIGGTQITPLMFNWNRGIKKVVNKCFVLFFFFIFLKLSVRVHSMLPNGAESYYYPVNLFLLCPRCSYSLFSHFPQASAQISPYQRDLSFSLFKKLCQNLHNIKLTTLTILSVQISGMKHIHTCCTTITTIHRQSVFHPAKLKLTYYVLTPSLPPTSSPWQLPFYLFFLIV